MFDVKTGDIIGYWENYRANGKIGGWAPRHFRGLVVKVNARTIHVKRQIGRQMVDKYVLYGYRKEVDIIPIERCYAVEASYV